MNVVALGFVLVLAGIFQSLFQPWTHSLGNARVPFLLGLALYYALNRSQGMMLLASGLAGFIQDSMSDLPLGTSSLCFCGLGLFFNRYRADLFGQRWITTFWTGLAAAAFMVVFTAIVLSSLRNPVPFSTFVAKLGGTLVLSIIFLPIIAAVLAWLDRWLGLGSANIVRSEDLL